MHRIRTAQSIAIGALVLAATTAFADGGTISGEVAGRTPKGRIGVVVHLEGVPGTFRPPAKPTAIDQKGMTFIPHVVAVQKGGTVVFHNSDALRHNVFTPDGDKYNLGTWGMGESKPHTFTATGIYHQLCNVHPEMGGIIMVLDNPFFAVTGDDGKFTIPNVPPGKYTIKTWGEKLPDTSHEVAVASGAPAKLDIKVGK